jgi:hypothetical protein
MRPGQLIRTLSWLAVGLFLTLTMSTMAQVQTQTTTTPEAATQTVTVERGEVVYVSGHDLILKMEDGEIRHIANVPESARATVDGKEIGIHDVKVGMKLQKTITATSAPTIITKVETVTGKVFNVMPPVSVILTLEDGTNQEFKIPKDQKFNVDGQMVDAFGLRKGMNISATKVTETPENIVTQKTTVTGKMPPPPPPPPDVPILIVLVPLT